MADIRDVVFDCRHPASLARFWAAVLDGYEVALYDEDERSRLQALGIDDPEDDPTVLVQPRLVQPDGPGPGPRLWFQRVPEHKVSKNRVHLDLSVEEGRFDAELERIESLGATRDPRPHHPGLLVLHDPEGNEFCLLR